MMEQLEKLFKEELKDGQSERSMIKHPFGCSFYKTKESKWRCQLYCHSQTTLFSTQELSSHKCPDSDISFKSPSI